MTDSRGRDNMGVHTQRKEVPPMSNADAVKKYHQKLDEFKIRPYAEEGQNIREYAATHGMSVQGLFLKAVREYMERHTLDIEEGTQ